MSDYSETLVSVKREDSFSGYPVCIANKLRLYKNTFNYSGMYSGNSPANLGNSQAELAHSSAELALLVAAPAQLAAELAQLPAAPAQLAAELAQLPAAPAQSSAELAQLAAAPAQLAAAPAQLATCKDVFTRIPVKFQIVITTTKYHAAMLRFKKEVSNTHLVYFNNPIN